MGVVPPADGVTGGVTGGVFGIAARLP